MASLIAHLRLRYQLLFLSPLFVWGFALAGGGLSARSVGGFFFVHVCLYGGITAYNSYYDRDEGPVGGLWVAPRVTEALLGFSLGIQFLGLVGVLFIGWELAALYSIVMLLSVAYSHPAFRWKARPLLSLLVVALGQGAIGYRAGWLCAGATPPASLARSPEGWLGLMTAMLLTTGFYPLSQLYQIDEDRRRGDLTFAVAYGPRASFQFALVGLAIGGICMVVTVFWRVGPLDAAVVAAAQLLLGAAVARWYLRFRADVRANFLTLHWLQALVSVGALGYVSVRLLWR